VDYLIDINNFHGPFDLLLHLVHQQELDIYEIEAHVIIEEYLNYIKKAQDLKLDIASEFLTMAATLIHLKSKMLIGTTKEEVNDEEYDINSVDDVKSRIIEYEKYKEMTETFKELEEKRLEFYTKSPESLKEYSDSTIKNDGTITVDDLVNAFLSYQERINLKKPLHTKITKKELSVQDKIKNIKEKLQINKKMDFFDLFEEYNKEHLIVTFLAILEMNKNKEINIYQEKNFDKIIVEGI